MTGPTGPAAATGATGASYWVQLPSPNANDIYYGPANTLGGNVGIGTISTAVVGGSNNLVAGGNVYVSRQMLFNSSSTVLVPGVSILGQQSTGLYAVATNTIGVTAGGVDALRIGPNTGNTSIGATNQIAARGDMFVSGGFQPSSSLNSSDTQHGIIWATNPAGASGSAWIKWYNGGFSTLYTTLEIGTGSDQHDVLYFNLSGNMGIGVSNPSYKVDVSGDLNVSGNLRVQGTAVVPGSLGFGSVTSVGLSAGNVGIFTVSGSPVTGSGTLTFNFNGTALGATLGGTGQTSYTIGDLLVASSSTALTKLSDVAAGSVLASGGVGLQPSWSSGPTLSTLTLNSSSGPQLTFGGANNNFVTFQTVGVSAPTFTNRGSGTKLVLYNTLGSATVDFGLGYNTNTLWSSVQSATVSNVFAWYGGTTQVGVLTGTGNISVTGEVTAYSSDSRLKLDVANIPDALTKVAAINGVTFSWDRDKTTELGFTPHSGRDVGVIAQEIAAVLPEAVRPAPFDWDHHTQASRSGENYLTVQYEKLTALLIEAVKQLKSELDELRQRVDGA